MKLKDRIRIALQVLFKGTCSELQESGMAKDKAERAAYTFEHAAMMVNDGIPSILCKGDVVQRVLLSDIDLRIKPSEHFRDKWEPQTLHIYSLAYIEDRHDLNNRMLYNADVLEYVKKAAAVKIAEALIRGGLLKMDVEDDIDGYPAKRLRFWLPYYQLQK